MDELTREFLIESQEGLDRMERCLTDLEERPKDAELIGEIFRSVHTIKGTTGFLGFKRLETLAHAGENLLGQLREGKLTANEPIITGLLQLLDGLRSILKTIEAKDAEGEGDDAVLIGRLEELQLPAQAEAKKPVHAKAGTRSAAAPPAPILAQAKTPEPVPVAQPTPKAEAEADPARPRAQATAAESTLRVDVTLLNRMMNLVGELVLTRNQVLQATAADPSMTMLSRRLDMVTADLRESVMKARMQPVSNIFSKMPRIVRDLSQTLGRRVRLQVEGQDTELDKSLLEAIKDPLTHAVRNSLDHGIEPPEVRQAAGKDPEGTLKLRAAQEGSHVIIEVSDDGAGIAITTAAAKLIADLPQHPRRTIRVVLWGSEENGGSAQAYAEAHKAEVSKLVIAGESDLGADRVYQVALPVGLPGLEEVMAPLKVIVSPEPPRHGGSDIGGLQKAGVPILGVSNDATRYFDYHHSADDTLDIENRAELNQNVAVWASLVYLIAESGIDFHATPAPK